MIKNYIEKANFEDTGFSYTLSLINGKYKMVILYCLMEFGVVRYSELKRYIRSISHKTLSLSLKELEKDRLIIRTEYPQIPPSNFNYAKITGAPAPVYPAIQNPKLTSASASANAGAFYIFMYSCQKG